MTNDQKEARELFKQHGSFESVDGHAGLVFCIYPEKLDAFAAALEEKHQAKIAMLADAFNHSYPNISQLLNVLESEWRQQGAWSDWDESTVTAFRRLGGVMSATQQDTDAFIAEVGAKALEEAADELWDVRTNHSTNAIRTALRRMAAELRASAAKPEGKEVK